VSAASSSTTTAGAATSQDEVYMMEYYSYYFHYWQNEPNPYTCCGHLSQQIIVNAYPADWLTIS
jgi:hypothetical protein